MCYIVPLTRKFSFYVTHRPTFLNIHDNLIISINDNIMQHWHLLYLYNILHSEEIDECKEIIDTCHSDAACTNTDGSFTCACNDGYSGDGVSCNGKYFWQLRTQSETLFRVNSTYFDIIMLLIITSIYL